MDRLKRNISKAVGLFLTLLFILPGCGVVAPEPPPTQSKTVTQSSSGEQITLRVATGDSGAGLIPHQRIIDQFEAENPDIVIELESIGGGDYYGRLLTAIRADEGFDILHIGDDALPRFVEQNALLPLDEFMDGLYPLDRQIYLPGLLEPGQWQGQQYLLPKDYSLLAIYYNKKIFDEQQVPYPQAGWTWAEFLATAQALTQDTDGDGQTDRWGVQLPASWTTGFEYWVATAGGQL
nr:extracellular solute-binding protein [Anaerolineae bacterium]